METTRKRMFYTMTGFTFALVLIGVKPLAAQGDCKVFYGATSKVFDTPAHSYVTTNIGGSNQTVELIYAAGAVYTKLNGKWDRSSMSMQEMKELDQKNRRDNKVTCKYLEDETVNGEMAEVYSVHEETPKKSKTDSQVWISKAKGLLLRYESDLGEKTHISTRMEYGDVKPPM